MQTRSRILPSLYQMPSIGSVKDSVENSALVSNDFRPLDSFNLKGLVRESITIGDHESPGSFLRNNVPSFVGSEYSQSEQVQTESVDRLDKIRDSIEGSELSSKQSIDGTRLSLISNNSKMLFSTMRAFNMKKHRSRGSPAMSSKESFHESS